MNSDVQQVTEMLREVSTGEKTRVSKPFGWILQSAATWVAVFTVLALSSCAEKPEARTESPQLVAGSTNTFLLKNDELQFSMVIPEGFRNYPEGIKYRETKHFFIKGQVSDPKSVVVINIKDLGGLLSPDVALNRKRLKEQLAPEWTLITKVWRGLTVDAYTVPLEQAGVSMIGYTIRIPLKPSAIELAVFGAASKREEINTLVESLLVSLKGDTNW